MYIRTHCCRAFIPLLLCSLLLHAFITQGSSFEIDQFCQADYSGHLLCYVKCFERIIDLLPNGIDVDKITGLVVRQSNHQCDTDAAVNIFQRFTNLQELYFAGFACPFSRLPVITTLKKLELIPSEDRHKDREKLPREASKETLLLNLSTLAVRELCCDLFRGHIFAPALEDLAFQCSRASSYISGLNETEGLLSITAPRLKNVEYTESGLGFPVSSVANLPEIESLIVTPNAEFYADEFLLAKTAMNLSTIRELTISFEEVGPFSQHYFQCVDLGNTNLTKVRILHPSVGTLMCPALWRCASCHPNTSNENQTVDIYLFSNSYVKLSTILPKITLNTTDFSLHHGPLLHLDGDALSRFSHLRSLQVREFGTNMGTKYSGKVILLDNPFKALKRPDELRYIRLFLVECGCLVYEAFYWLKEHSPNFRGVIQCSEVLQTTSAAERIEVGRWINVGDFLSKLKGRCKSNSSKASTDFHPNADRIIMQYSEDPTGDRCHIRTYSLLICVLLLFSIFCYT